MRQTANISQHIDWLTVVIFYLLVILGWLNIYAAVYDENAVLSIFNLDLNSGRQLIFIGVTLLLVMFIMVVDFSVFDAFAYVIYGVLMVFLVYVLLFAKEINGAKSWIQLGGFSFQPSEFAKFATALVLAKYMSSPTFKFNRFRNQLAIAAIVGLPAGLIILQGDTGTALVFGAFVFVLFREGMSPVILVAGLALGVLFILTLVLPKVPVLAAIALILILVFVLGKRTLRRFWIVLGVYVTVFAVVSGVDFAFNNVLKPHQQNRIKVLINPNVDPLGAGWNVTQSKIAIGSGGISGVGYLKGTQTKFDFVPEQSTDFIFCTIGEEHGWFGSVLMIGLFVTLLLRIVFIAERQKQRFSRIYGYSVASILFVHFAINIGMTIGLFPVIGIPLPFFSYGGSSLMAFTILLFILIKLDAHRTQMLAH